MSPCTGTPVIPGKVSASSANILQSHGTLKKWIDSQQTYCRRSSGISLDFERAYWTPPLCERIGA